MSHQPTPAPKLCPVCGKPASRTWCSQACNAISRRVVVVRHCPCCGVEFQPKISEARRGHGTYCSVACRRLHEADVGRAYPKKGTKSVHRLVAATMLGRPLLPWEVVHHKDGNRKNNAPENLEVLPNHSTHMRHHARRGEDSDFAKLTWEQVREIRRRRAAGETARSLAQEFGIDPSNVRLIVRGKTWKE